ncbi:MAG: hypothetical protein K2X43_00705 [Hyphomonadaceae bacterium]|nr:hypothetical protein [Hyphomonadaceae bacterium]
MVAAHTLGYGAIMFSDNRSGHPLVRELLHLADSEEMVGFISIATPAKHILPKHRPLPSAHLEVSGGREPTNEPARISLNRSRY